MEEYKHLCYLSPDLVDPCCSDNFKTLSRIMMGRNLHWSLPDLQLCSNMWCQSCAMLGSLSASVRNTGLRQQRAGRPLLGEQGLQTLVQCNTDQPHWVPPLPPTSLACVRSRMAHSKGSLEHSGCQAWRHRAAPVIPVLDVGLYSYRRQSLIHPLVSLLFLTFQHWDFQAQRLTMIGSRERNWKIFEGVPTTP